jgi:hypothetical protein
MKGKGLGLVPLVNACSIKRLEALHQNHGSHWNQVPTNLVNSLTYKVIWQQQKHSKATNILDFGSSHVAKP